MTWMGTRLVTPLAGDASGTCVAVVAGSWLALYAALPSSLPLVMRTTTVLRQARLAAVSARHRRDRGRLRVDQRVVDRTIVVADAAEAGRNEAGVVADATVGDRSRSSSPVFAAGRHHHGAGRRRRLRVVRRGDARRVDPNLPSAAGVARVRVAVEQPGAASRDANRLVAVRRRRARPASVCRSLISPQRKALPAFSLTAAAMPCFAIA